MTPERRKEICKKYRTSPKGRAATLKRRRAWRDRNRDRLRQQAKALYEKNREHISSLRRAWRANNPEKTAAAITRFKQKHRKHLAAKERAREFAKMQACPAWADRQELGRIYAERPEGMQVDHIIPLRGKTVSGLHVPWNLQYLTPRENRIKWNRFDD